MLQRNWERRNGTGTDSRQPQEKKVAQLKEKQGKDIAAYQAKGKPDVEKRESPRLKKQEKEGRGEDEDDDE